MNDLRVILFYKFVRIENPEKFVKEHLKFCKNLGLLGRVLVSEEGINGSVAGTAEKIGEYEKYLKKDQRFSDMVFKEDPVVEIPFTKMKVRLRKEIVTFGKKVDFEKKGEYILPEKLKEMYENKEEFIILDARNYYEYKVGRFKNSVHLSIKNFREFPESLKKIKNLKNKKIVTYCTGGVRCEKASSYMKENGFKNVMQLKDGIINFGKQFPDTYWEGKCFVFDKRLVSKINTNEKTISNCEICLKPSDLYRNCRNLNCDKLIIECLSCQKELNGCCSQECLLDFRKQCIQKAMKNQGRKILGAITN
ncbi:MAG: rhodanese-related sulfurtransferase [Nanoarchaeota archaeon]|nr:rhodanese-related sulfurtransferase [Nanoarchaeota archaeon]